MEGKKKYFRKFMLQCILMENKNEKIVFFLIFVFFDKILLLKSYFKNMFFINIFKNFVNNVDIILF